MTTIIPQAEWLKTHNACREKGSEGDTRITGVKFDKDFQVESLNVRTPGLYGTAFGSLFPTYVKGYDGPKKFLYKDNQVYLVIGDDSNIIMRSSLVMPDGVKNAKNPKVIPRDKWTRDYCVYSKKAFHHEPDQIRSIEIVGCSLGHGNAIGSVNAKVEHNFWSPMLYHGWMIGEWSFELTRDILGGVYGMMREDWLNDDWAPNCALYRGYHACFNENFDVIFDDDGKYHKLNCYGLDPFTD